MFNKIFTYIKHVPIVRFFIYKIHEIPVYAFHWYSILVLSGIVLVALMVLSWMVLPMSHGGVSVKPPEQVLLDKGKLMEAIQIQIKREQQYKALQSALPNIIDPGR